MKRLTFLMLLACSGCALVQPGAHREERDERDSETRIPEHMTEQIGAWWETFNDPRLSAMVRLSLAHNRDLQMAVSRIDQTRAALRQSSAARWPQIDFAGSASKARALLFAGPEGQVIDTIDQYGLSVGAAYEVDLWRRIDASIDAAQREFEATEFDFESVAMSLSASVAETWFALNERLATVTLLEEQLAVSRDYVDLTELRFGQGLASALDVYQQRQQEASLRSLLPKAQAQAQVLEHSLAVLIGRLPEAGETLAPKETHLPVLGDLPELDLPVDLLDVRPDIKAASARFSAAERRVVAARADRLPSLGLNGRAGYQSDELNTLFDNTVAEASASLSLPLADGGGRKAEVDRMQAVREERFHAFSQAVLKALEEVRNAIVQEREQYEFIGNLEEQIALADQTLTQSRDRYANGLIDYLNVLTALSRKQQLERDALSAHRELLSYRIQFHRAVGGKLPREAEEQ